MDGMGGMSSGVCELTSTVLFEQSIKPLSPCERSASKCVLPERCRK